MSPPDALAPDFDWDTYVRGAAPAVGFHLDREQIAVTAGWLRALADLARPLLQDPIHERAQSAPIFLP